MARSRCSAEIWPMFGELGHGVQKSWCIATSTRAMSRQREEANGCFTVLLFVGGGTHRRRATFDRC